MKIYVASSWRNERQPEVVRVLRVAGHDVYDFKRPTEDDHGFHWSQIDPNWQAWAPHQFKQALNHPLAVSGFKSDLDAMKWTDACVMVMPCGRSAHLEAGYFIGAGKPCALLLSDGEPELMYAMAGDLLLCMPDVARWADHVHNEGPRAPTISPTIQDLMRHDPLIEKMGRMYLRGEYPTHGHFIDAVISMQQHDRLRLMKDMQRDMMNSNPAEGLKSD